MSIGTAHSGVTQVTVEAKIIRADGTVEELGRVAYWHRNPLRRWAWRVSQWLKGRAAGRITKGTTA